MSHKQLLKQCKRKVFKIGYNYTKMLDSVWSKCGDARKIQIKLTFRGSRIPVAMVYLVETNERI